MSVYICKYMPRDISFQYTIYHCNPYSSLQISEPSRQKDHVHAYFLTNSTMEIQTAGGINKIK
jgi:hypothetical protein